MSFDVGADAYGRFMGQFSEPLATAFVELLDPAAGQEALDVGCGPGALTNRLVDVLGSTAVSALDPSPAFVTALHERLPGVDVRRGGAESLPYADDRFDLVVAQLVVHFMADPPAGLTEMARVTRPGGRVAACVWDLAGGRSPLSHFWAAAADLDPAAPDESSRTGAREGDLKALLSGAGLRDVSERAMRVRVGFAGFDDWWEPYTLGVGPAGAYVADLDEEQRAALRSHCRDTMPAAPFTIEAYAWTAVGRVAAEAR